MKNFTGLSLIVAGAIACSSTEETPAPMDVFPDFSLVDQNPNSARFEQEISPRDHLEKVSGWYFIHAT
jgi:hypothetical protein